MICIVYINNFAILKIKNLIKNSIMKKEKWTIDAAHSEIQFKIRHLMISSITGQFNEFNGVFETENEDLATAKANFSADVNSIHTSNEQRDAHLRSNDFFDAENYPHLYFKSEKVEKTNQEEYKVYGTLTMRGISKPIILDAELGGITQDPWGKTRIGISLNGKVNRKDFAINFGLLTETGGVGLGEDVKIMVSAQFVKEEENTVE